MHLCLCCWPRNHKRKIKEKVILGQVIGTTDYFLVLLTLHKMMYAVFFHLIKKATFGTKLKLYHGYLLLSLQRQAKTSTSSTNKKTISVVPNAPEFVKPHPKQESMWATVLNNV